MVAFETSTPAYPQKAESSFLGKLDAALGKLPAPVFGAMIAALTFFIGWIDYETGWELSLFILYAAPIALAVWRLGSWAGFAVAVLSSAVWLTAHGAANPFSTALGYTWSMLNRFFYFGIVVFAVSAVRNKQNADAARIEMLEEQRQLEKDIVSVSEHEQQRIGQDLHDGLCQQLAAIGCAARVLSDDLQLRNNAEAHDAALIEESIRNAVVEARNLARGIYPVHVDRTGLSAALSDLAELMSRLTGTSIQFIESPDVSVHSPEISMNFYRIAQEALANAVRHSDASEIKVALSMLDKELELRVADNGKGMPVGARSKSEGMGLRTMRYRAQTLGAVLETSPNKGGGTVVTCRLNLNQIEV